MRLEVYQRIKHERNLRFARKAIDNLRKDLIAKGILRSKENEREDVLKIKYNPLIEQIKDSEKRSELKKRMWFEVKRGKRPDIIVV